MEGASVLEDAGLVEGLIDAREGFEIGARQKSAAQRDGGERIEDAGELLELRAREDAA